MSVRYDGDKVKRPNEELEYTQEQILELEKCAGDVGNFLKYVKIIHPDRGEVVFDPYEYQWRFLKLIKENRFVAGLFFRQSGKTSIVSAYALWFATFNSNKTIGIVSNKEKSAKMILARMKQMYVSIPAWLKPGVKEWSIMSVRFDNNTRIVISATSEDAFRGESLSLLLCDELAFVPKNQCLDKESFVYMRDKETNKIEKISIENLYNSPKLYK